MAGESSVEAVSGEHVLAGRYVLRKQLTDDGVILTCRAFDRSLDRDVGVHVLTPEASRDLVETFRRETERAALVRHPNVCSVLDYVPPGDKPSFSVVQFVDAPNLRDWLAKRGPLSNEEVRLIGLQWLAGVACGHDQGVVHGGLTPERVHMVPPTEGVAVRQDCPKVSGYGLAGVVQAAAKVKDRTGKRGAGSVCLSPEQRRGEHANSRSDVYSSGCLLYLLATGKMPVTDPSTGRESPTPPSLLNPALTAAFDEVVLTALNPDPEQRYADARALREAFGTATRSAPALNTPDTLRPGPKKAAESAGASGASRLSAAEAGAALAAALDEDTHGAVRPAASATPRSQSRLAAAPHPTDWEEAASSDGKRRRLLVLALGMLLGLAAGVYWLTKEKDGDPSETARGESVAGSPLGGTTPASPEELTGSAPRDFAAGDSREGAAGFGAEDQEGRTPGTLGDAAEQQVRPSRMSERPSVVTRTPRSRRRRTASSRRAREEPAANTSAPTDTGTATASPSAASEPAGEPAVEPPPVVAPVARPAMNRSQMIGDIEGNPYLH